MSVLEFLVYESGSQRRKVSSAETVQFAALQVGTTPLLISEVAGAFDFDAKQLINLAAPTANNHAATKLYVDNEISAIDGDKADRSLGNLTSVAINVALLPATGLIDLASNSLAFRDLFVQNVKNGADTVLDVVNKRLRDGTNLSIDLTLRRLADSAGVAVLDYNTDIKIGSPSAVVPLKFMDADGSNHVGFQAPAVVASNVMWTLPNADAAVPGYVLSSNAAGILSWANPVATAPSEFADDLFRIADDGDPTKKIAFQASGIAASTTRTITMPDADVDLGLLALRTLNNLTTTSINASLLPNAIATLDVGSGLLPWNKLWARSLESDAALGIVADLDLSLTSTTGDVNVTAAQDIVLGAGSSIVRASVDGAASLGSASFHWTALFVNSISAASLLQINSPVDMSSQVISNLAAPVAANDAVTKAYADSLTGTVSDWKLHCRAATSGNVALTGVHPLITGGVTLAFGDRVLLRAQTLPEQNGIYDYLDDGLGDYVFTRSSDADSSEDLLSAVTFVAEGDYARRAFYQTEISGPGVSQVEEFDFTGLTGASFDVVGNGLILNLAGGLGYVWFNVTDGVNAPQVDPTGTGIQVQCDILLADNATAIALAAVNAIALAGISGVVPNSTLEVLEVTYDPADLTDGDAGDSGTTYTLVTSGVDPGLDIDVDAITWREFASSSKVEYRTLTAPEITAAAITLAFTPSIPSEVALDVIGGTAQFYSDDFVVIGNLLDWSSLALDGVLIAGDKIRVMYQYY